ncbi:hypothetical protein V2J09_000766, partial [Rumex salicifolius]
ETDLIKHSHKSANSPRLRQAPTRLCSSTASVKSQLARRRLLFSHLQSTHRTVAIVLAFESSFSCKVSEVFISMSETSCGLVAPDQPNTIGPDFFSYYAREVADLLQDDECQSFNPRATESESAGKVVENGNREDCSCVKPLFSDIMVDLDSEAKKGLLKTLLRESVSTLTQEVDEIFDPIVSLRHERSQLRCKNQQLNVEVQSKDEIPERPCKKRKAELSSSAHGMSIGDALKSDLAMQVDDNEDRIQLEQILEKHAKEYTLILNHMDKQLEAILETAISRCRTMTRVEKQELKASIQKLPPKNLDRVAEILFRNKPSDLSSPDEVFVDLEDEDNTTLWRLYFYVMAVDNARKLAR